jgi:outer membrane biosynthesis protein TonB
VETKSVFPRSKMTSILAFVNQGVYSHMYAWPERPRRLSLLPFILISLTIHFWFAWVSEYMSQLEEMLQQMQAQTQPLQVRLRALPPPQPEQPMPLERRQPFLIEDNPNANQEEVEEAEILSVENSSAQEGGGDSPPGEEASQQAENSSADFIPEGADGFSSALVGPNLAAGEKSGETAELEMPEDRPAPMPKNGIGASFSLSSYAWEWAPWVLALRDKFGRTINPPPVYTHLGLVDGLTRVKFVINRDGTLASYTVISHDGHQILEKTTVESIEAVFPFRPLPDDFPDPKLIIIGNFIYPNLRQLARP